jgi:hypothetical protein
MLQKGYEEHLNTTGIQQNPRKPKELPQNPADMQRKCE